MWKKRVFISFIAMMVLTASFAMGCSPENNEPPPQYSIEVEKSVINESVVRLEAAGFWPEIVSGIVHDVGIVLGFYEQADPEAVAIVKAVIDEMAPGLPFQIRENIGPLTLYPQMLMEAVHCVASARLQSAGFLPDFAGYFPDPKILAGFGYGIDGIILAFYGETEPEAVVIVRVVIDKLAPGLPLKIVENVTIVTPLPDVSPLEDTTWVLESYGEPESMKTALPDVEVTLFFDSTEKRFTGIAGCNSYSGSYELNDNDLSILGVAWTQLKCSEEVGNQEAEYIPTFSAAKSYQIEDGKLTLKSGQQVIIYISK